VDLTAASSSDCTGTPFLFFDNFIAGGTVTPAAAVAPAPAALAAAPVAAIMSTVIVLTILAVALLDLLVCAQFGWICFVGFETDASFQRG